MLDQIFAMLCLVTFPAAALGMEQPSNPQEAVVNFVADNPRAMLEILVLQSTISEGPGMFGGFATASSWRPLCYSPCRVSVKLVDELRVGGDGIQASSPVLINPGTTELNLTATTGATNLHVASLLLIMAGAGSVLGGGSLLLYGAMIPSQSALIPVGAVAMASGLAVAIVGVVLNGIGGSTSLQVSGGREGSRSQAIPW